MKTGVDAGDGNVSYVSLGGNLSAYRRRIDAEGGFEVSNLAPLNQGDRWTFRVYGGVPAVTSVTTAHFEPSIPARGPFEGNTEITVGGHGFFPSERNLLCRLHDDTTGTTQVLQARFVSSTTITCVTTPHAPLGASFRDPSGALGSKVIGTVSPCVFKTVQASTDGGVTWSEADAEKAPVFLFCDVHVAVSGSDVVGKGTPDAPYATIRRAVEAALGEARLSAEDDEENSHEENNYSQESSEDSSVASPSRRRFFGRSAWRGGGNDRGFSRCVNRDRIRLAPGVYSGHGAYIFISVFVVRTVQAIRLTLVCFVYYRKRGCSSLGEDARGCRGAPRGERGGLHRRVCPVRRRRWGQARRRGRVGKFVYVRCGAERVRVFANVRTFGLEMRIGREFEQWTTQAFRQLTKETLAVAMKHSPMTSPTHL